MIVTIGKLPGAFVCAMLLLAIALIAWPRSTAPLPDARRAYLIEGVRVVDVVAGTAGLPTAVIIRNGLIEAIGASPPMAGLARVDGRGGFLAPGFWDMHIHTFRHSPLVDFPLYVANGVTNARDMMDCPSAEDSLIACVDDKRRWSAQADAGRLTSPRFVEVASYYLEGPALTPARRVALTIDLHARFPILRLGRSSGKGETRRRERNCRSRLQSADGLDRLVVVGFESQVCHHSFPDAATQGATRSHMITTFTPPGRWKFSIIRLP